MTISWTQKTFFLFSFLILMACILTPSILAGQFNREPIKETQTKPVPVTPELLKGEKTGAPAPSYKMVEDSPEFLTVETVDPKAKEVSTQEDLLTDEASELEFGSDDFWLEETQTTENPEYKEEELFDAKDL